MRLVDRLIYRELRGPLLNSFFLFVVMLFSANYLFKVTDLLVQGVPLPTVLRLALYSLPASITQALPMAMLLGCLLAFGRLSADSETIAAYASGISFYRLVRPVAVVGLLVSVITIAWNETVVPPSMRAYFRTMHDATEKLWATDRPLDYSQKREDGSVDEHVIIDGGYDARTQTLRRVTILKMSDDPARKGRPDVVIYAEKAIARDPRGTDWEFFNVFVQPLRVDPQAGLQAHSYFQKLKTLPRGARIGKTFRGIMEAEVKDNRRMTFRQLSDKINQERAQGEDTAADEVDLWEKVSLPLASLIFGLVGAPLGVRPQRGSKAMGFGIAIVIIFLYWVVYHWSYLVGKGGGMPPMLASFAADLLGLIAAVFLVSRTRQ